MLEEYVELLRRARHLEIDLEAFEKRLRVGSNSNQAFNAREAVKKAIDALRFVEIGKEAAQRRPE